MIRFVSFVLLLQLSFSASAQVWVDSQTWTPEWENKYSAWVKESWNVNVFSKTTLSDGRKNPYYGLKADCADVVYSMRAIFAYENALPFAVVDPTGSGKRLSNKMTRFNGVSDSDARFRKFLGALHGTLGTMTLPSDTYPIALSPQALRPGILLLTTKLNHHSWTVKDFLNVGVPWLIYSSRVNKATSLTLQERKSWPNPKWVYEGNQTPSGHAGFRAFRPIEFLGQPVWKVPGYDEEQYKISLNLWRKTIQKRVAQTEESSVAQLNRILNSVCEGLTARVSQVQEGLDFLNGFSGCMDYATYDNYSTPNRDQRLFDDMVSLREAYRDALNHSNETLPSEMNEQFAKIYPHIQEKSVVETEKMVPQTPDSRSLCLITYPSANGPVTMDLAEAKRRMFLGNLSNNPHDPVEYRWGESSGHSKRAEKCESWDDWAPDLNAAD